ncbi:phytoene desaturase family protein [Rossellomorea sp. H39__3]
MIRSGTKVKKILVEGREAKGIMTSTGEEVRGDFVIVNGDYITATKELLEERDRPSTPDQKLDAYEPSISAFVILAGLREFQPDIHHHQVFFTDDYKEEFDDIFYKKRLPKDPTIYISHSAATDPGVTKGSNLFILVNAPAVNLTEEEVMRYKTGSMMHLNKRGSPSGVSWSSKR